MWVHDYLCLAFIPGEIQAIINSRDRISPYFRCVSLWTNVEVAVRGHPRHSDRHSPPLPLSQPAPLQCLKSSFVPLQLISLLVPICASNPQSSPVPCLITFLITIHPPLLARLHESQRHACPPPTVTFRLFRWVELSLPTSLIPCLPAITIRLVRTLPRNPLLQPHPPMETCNSTQALRSPNTIHKRGQAPLRAIRCPPTSAIVIVLPAFPEACLTTRARGRPILISNMKSTSCRLRHSRCIRRPALACIPKQAV